MFQDYNFNKKELIEVFASISLFAEAHFDSKAAPFNMDINFHSSSFKRIDFCQTLSHATSIDYRKVSSIVDFLTFNEGKSKDLWAFPLIKIDDNCIAVIVPASIAPMPQRVGEFWIKGMGLNETSKGKHYETKIIELLKEHLNKNEILSKNVDVFGPVELTCDGGREEIDLLIRIENKIILIDIKCISSIDSPVSEWNSLCKIKHGANQVIRKAEFLKNNEANILKHLKIKPVHKCEIYPYVLVSNLSFNGVQVDSVPVIDADILISYFSSGNLDMLHLDGKPYVNINLYSDLHEAALKFDYYFKNPFQTNYSFDFYKILPEIYKNTLSSLKAVDPLSSIDQFIEVGCYEYILSNFSYVNKRSDDLMFYRIVKAGQMNKDIYSKRRTQKVQFISSISNDKNNEFNLNDSDKVESVGQYIPTFDSRFDDVVNSNRNAGPIILAYNNYFIKKIEEYKMDDLRYNFNGVIISRYKVLRIYETLIKNHMAGTLGAIKYAICKNSILTEEQYRNIEDCLEKVYGKNLRGVARR